MKLYIGARLSVSVAKLVAKYQVQNFSASFLPEKTTFKRMLSRIAQITRQRAVRTAPYSIVGSYLYRQASSMAKTDKERQEELKKFLEGKKVDEQGYFIRPDDYSKQDIKNTAYGQYMQKIEQEKLDLIEEKLALLAESEGVPVEQLKKKLDALVKAQQDEEATELDQAQSTIDSFQQQLQSINDQEYQTMELFQGLVIAGDSSPALKFVEEIDPQLADKIKSLIGNHELTENDYRELLEASKSSNFAQITENEVNTLKELIRRAIEEPAEDSEASLSEPTVLVSRIFDELTSHETLDDSPLYRIVGEVDSTLSNLLKEYSEVDPKDAQLVKEKYNELVENLGNPKSAFRKVLFEDNSDATNKLKALLSGADRIDLLDVVDAAQRAGEQLADSPLFAVVSKLDPKLAELLQQGSDIAEHVQDPQTPIYQILEDVTSEGYQELEQALQQLGITKGSIEQQAANTVDEELEQLKNEDQTALPEEVAAMNKAYDVALEAIEELKKDIQMNRLDQPGSTVSDQVSKLLGFVPSANQTEQAKEIDSRPIPVQSDKVLDFCVNLIMRDGKKDIARKYLNRTLYLIYLQTRRDPAEILKNALDVLAPLVTTKTKPTGFAKNVTVPQPLTHRQRMRMSFLWIMEASQVRASHDFPVRLAEEILNVEKGNSKLLDKRAMIHKRAIAVRSYLKI